MLPLEYQLLRAGARYERAALVRDYPRMIDLENWFVAINADPAVTFQPGVWFVRGRNFVRLRRGLGEVHL